MKKNELNSLFVIGFVVNLTILLLTTVALGRGKIEEKIDGFKQASTCGTVTNGQVYYVHGNQLNINDTTFFIKTDLPVFSSNGRRISVNALTKGKYVRFAINEKGQLCALQITRSIDSSINSDGTPKDHSVKNNIRKIGGKWTNIIKPPADQGFKTGNNPK